MYCISFPSESLPESNGSPLLESITISYHFSSQFLVPPLARQAGEVSYEVLSMAPFSNAGMPIGHNTSLGRLPASLTEIEGLPGEQFTDRKATKAAFLHHLNQFPVVHVVTHAVADLNNSNRSFLAFYPLNGSLEENRLYAEELYGLNMDAD